MGHCHLFNSYNFVTSADMAEVLALLSVSLHACVYYNTFIITAIIEVDECGIYKKQYTSHTIL